jgi:hypothetical protein
MASNQLEHFTDCLSESQLFKRDINIELKHSIDLPITSLPAPLGLVTPYQAFGADFVLSLPGCSRVDIPPSESDSQPYDDVHTSKIA